jgi:hypothetical protein
LRLFHAAEEAEELKSRKIEGRILRYVLSREIGKKGRPFLDLRFWILD